MTDERPEDRAAAPDPEVERAVRDLLREARETGPVPDDVAARIDAALAEAGRESAERARTPPTRPGTTEPGTTRHRAVVPLRRRGVRRALVAAGAVAALAVVGVPVATSVLQGAGEDQASSGAGGSTAQSESADEPAPPRDAPQEAAPGDRDRSFSAPSGARGSKLNAAETSPAAGWLLLSDADYATQVTAFVRAGGVGPPAAAACGAPREPGSRLVGVRLDGILGTLVLSAADGDVATELYLCGRAGPQRARVVTLP